MWGLREVELFLKKRACEAIGDDILIFYGDLYELVGIKNKENIEERNYVHGLLYELSTGEHAQGHPLLSVIVVRQSDYMPGPGFFDLARNFLPDEYLGIDDDAIFVAEFNKVKSSKQIYCQQI